MKVLVLSLLRLGDVMLMSSTLKRLKEASPEIKLHVLINREARAVIPLLPWVDRWIEFDRTHLQKTLGEEDYSMLDGFGRLSGLLNDLKAEEYDAVYNLTHTRLSGWIAGCLEQHLKTGLGLTSQGQPFIASSWFRYLNDSAATATHSRFHMADVYAAGSGFEHSWHPLQLTETEAGLSEAARLAPQYPFIVVQPLTSDKKKSWSREKFAQTLRIFAILHPECAILLLGAPFEEAELRELARRLAQLKVKSHVAIASLEGALSLCQQAKVVLTGDTSIKHLAASTSARIVEISIGSSHLYATGVYSPDNLIIQAQEACAPCPHAQACSQPTHACSERLSPELVALATSKLMQQDFSQLKIVAEQYRDEAVLYRTDWSESGLWQALPLGASFNRSAVAAWVERVSWQVVLSGQNTTNAYNAHAARLSKTLFQIYPNRSQADWRLVFKDLEEDLEKQLQDNDRKTVELKIVRTLLAEIRR